MAMQALSTIMARELAFLKALACRPLYRAEAISPLSSTYKSSLADSCACSSSPDVLADTLDPVAQLVDASVPLLQSPPHALDLLHV